MADLRDKGRELGDWWHKRDRGVDGTAYGWLDGEQAMEPTYLEFDAITSGLGALGAMAGSIKFASPFSAVRKNMNANVLHAKDPHFKQGLSDHINAKDKRIFSDSEKRTYFDNISPYVNKMTTEGAMQPRLHRGMKVAPDDEMLLLNEGDYFYTDRVMPFTTNFEVADKYAMPSLPNKPHGVMINLDKRRSGIDIVDLRQSNPWSESEVTMPANALFKVKRVQKTDNGQGIFENIIDIDEVDSLPKGARLLKYRDGDTNDYTNPEEMRTFFSNKQKQIDNLKRPRLKEIYNKRMKETQHTLDESNRMKPAGAKDTTVSKPEFEPITDLVGYITDLI